MPETSPRIAYITAGAAGMYCGSCLRDNTLASTLQKKGIDIQLVPTYTPLRTDEEDVSIDRVFFGGINVYLQQKIPLFRHLPRVADWILDQPRLIRWASQRSLSTDPRDLGDLVLSMLRGMSGNQRREVVKLVDWLRTSRPQLINLSNMLIAGCVPALKKALNLPVLVTLQGDDIFMEGLSASQRRQALVEIERLVESIDGFIVFSRFYADFMADLFHIPLEKIEQVPMGICLNGYPTSAPTRKDGPLTIGYLARLCPAKGLHLLVDAFLELHQRTELKDLRLSVAGWLSESDRVYAESQFAKLHNAGLGDAFTYAGAIDRNAKIDFLQTLDVLSVPTVHREPKGLYVLESLACGVPVVQPHHGAFPELLSETGGGRLFEPNDVRQLSDRLYELITDAPLRAWLGREGQTNVHDKFSAEQMAQATMEIYQKHMFQG